MSKVNQNPMLDFDLCLQVTSMRKEAQDYRNQLLSEIRASVGTRGQAAAASTSASSSGEQGAIKKKLENAIVIMQEGLVERQAEVGHPFKGRSSLKRQGRDGSTSGHPPLPSLPHFRSACYFSRR